MADICHTQDAIETGVPRRECLLIFDAACIAPGSQGIPDEVLSALAVVSICHQQRETT